MAKRDRVIRIAMLNDNPNGITLERFLKRAFYLVWKACDDPIRMGKLQDNPEATEDDVWNNIMNAADYPGGRNRFEVEDKIVYADYVFGRMVKWGCKLTNDYIKTEITKFDPEYQSFTPSYPTNRKIFEATAESLSCTYGEFIK